MSLSIHSLRLLWNILFMGWISLWNLEQMPVLYGYLCLMTSEILYVLYKYAYDKMLFLWNSNVYDLWTLKRICFQYAILIKTSYVKYEIIIIIFYGNFNLKYNPLDCIFMIRYMLWYFSVIGKFINIPLLQLFIWNICLNCSWYRPPFLNVA